MGRTKVEENDLPGERSGFPHVGYMEHGVLSHEKCSVQINSGQLSAEDTQWFMFLWKLKKKKCLIPSGDSAVKQSS